MPSPISSICTAHRPLLPPLRVQCEYLFDNVVTFRMNERYDSWKQVALYESHMLIMLTAVTLYISHIYRRGVASVGQKLCFNLIWLWSPADADVVIAMTCSRPAYVYVYGKIGNIRSSRCRRRSISVCLCISYRTSAQAVRKIANDSQAKRYRGGDIHICDRL